MSLGFINQDLQWGKSSLHMVFGSSGRNLLKLACHQHVFFSKHKVFSGIFPFCFAYSDNNWCHLFPPPLPQFNSIEKWGKRRWIEEKENCWSRQSKCFTSLEINMNSDTNIDLTVKLPHGCPHLILKSLSSSPGSAFSSYFLLKCTLEDGMQWFRYLETWAEFLGLGYLDSEPGSGCSLSVSVSLINKQILPLC